MVATRRQAAAQDTNPYLIPGVIEEFEIIDRPPLAQKRSKYHIDSQVEAVIKATEAGRVVRIRPSKEVGKKLLMSFRNYLRNAEYKYRYASAGDDAIIMWAEKITATTKKGAK